MGLIKRLASKIKASSEKQKAKREEAKKRKAEEEKIFQEEYRKARFKYIRLKARQKAKEDVMGKGGLKKELKELSQTVSPISIFSESSSKSKSKRKRRKRKAPLIFEPAYGGLIQEWLGMCIWVGV